MVASLLLCFLRFHSIILIIGTGHEFNTKLYKYWICSEINVPLILSCVEEGYLVLFPLFVLLEADEIS